MHCVAAYSVAPPGYRPPTDADLRHFEEQIGGRLPGGYREFLVAHGWTRGSGGAVFMLREPAPAGATSAVQRFFGLHPNPELGLVGLTLGILAGRIPSETIPIAEALMGDLVLLGFHGSDANRVLLWDHDYAGHMPEIRADLDACGTGPDALNDHLAIWYWEGSCRRRHRTGSASRTVT
jgi:hypothetical protein